MVDKIYKKSGILNKNFVDLIKVDIKHLKLHLKDY